MQIVNKKTTLWEEGKAKTITFILTEDCQLRCKYCYIIGKNSNKRMGFDIAKKAVDYILSDKTQSAEKSVIFDFIGGEPFLEIELIDQICDYIKTKLFETDHPWFSSYRFSFSTNGILYDSEKVQEYIRKNKTHLSIGITIDGTKQKHDLQRVFPDGSGSYDAVVRNIPLWLAQFPDSSTKVTVASEDIPYIKESVIHLWNLGIKEINSNVVFENVWKENDDLLFEEQLIQLADYILDNKIYLKKLSCSFFSETIGKPLFDNQNWCGAGLMLAIDSDGNFYPCLRFAGFSLQNKKPVIIGNCFGGIDTNRLRPFLTLDRIIQSPEECIDCEVASGCAWCQGANYDFADTDTIFQRATFLCKMHKARVRANDYFWDKLGQLKVTEKEAYV
jgi:uncharacterized protein